MLEWGSRLLDFSRNSGFQIALGCRVSGLPLAFRELVLVS